MVFYFHPWEMDPDQPRFVVGRTTRFRHYTGLRTTADRLRRLVADFHFDSAAAVLNLAVARTSARTA